MKLILLFVTFHLLLVNANIQPLLDFVYAATSKISLTPCDPSKVTEDDVTFYLFNKTSKTDPIVLTKDNVTALSKTKQLKVVIHGYFEHGLKKLYTDIKDQYLLSYDYNVILVDWEGPALKMYMESAANTRLVGKIIAGRILKSGIDPNLVHIIGHSLGAQTAGFAGKELRANGKKIARITGLDPAGPGFEGSSVDNKLNKDDALVVDVIHTDSGVFGMLDNVGKVDYYPNGGVAFQKGCLDSLTIPVDYESVAKIACSHQRSVIFFTESINSKKFRASQRCPSYLLIPTTCYDIDDVIIMGEHNLPNTTGMYYLETNGSPPYAQG